MKRKGINFKPAYHLGYRQAKDGDTYIDGTPIERPYIVIVSIKDCKVNENNKYNPENANPIPLKYHGRTNMAYGKQREWKNKSYHTSPAYWVEDGRVYQGTIRNYWKK